MLYTRCPECDTTFRVTEAALQQAEGQVRCGRCAHIFDANDSLTDRLEDPDELETASAADGDSSPAPDDAHSEASTRKDAEGRADERDRVSQPEKEESADSVMSSTDVVAVLDEPVPAAVPEWLDDDHRGDASRQTWRWMAAGIVGLIALTIQLAHHYRSELARQAITGPAIQLVYSWVGRSIEPAWEVDRYELLDWIAVAEPAQNGHGNLIIRSQLQNAADRPQPYPLVWLRLLDRWDESVAARLFEPDEYLVTAPDGALMSPGTTVAAELVLVDPGADAYGFELAVCVDIGRQVECDTDATFRD